MEQRFSEILRERLEGENLSAIAREIGIPKTILHDWVQSRRLPSMKNIHYVSKLGEYLGLTLEQLFFGQDEKKILSSISFNDEDREYRILIERVK
jgi:hypothetical protein